VLTLYEYPNSVCCQKVNLALFEKDLVWEPIFLNLAANEHFIPEYLKLNPKAVVPTLMHDGLPIIESTLICEYLEETFSRKSLMPGTPLERTQMRWWTKAIDEGLHDGVADISFSAMFRDRMKRMSEDRRQVRFRNIGDPRRTDRTKNVFEKGVQSPFVRNAVYAFEAAFNSMEFELSKGSEWLVGNTYSLADVGLTPYVARLEYLDILDVWTGNRPKFGDWWNRIKSRPSYARAVSGPLSDTEIQEMNNSGYKIKDQIARLRDALKSTD
jgi:glutathione S-transferase